jgi:pimeloyl-ACP methyl ester carboxylesterase
MAAGEPGSHGLKVKKMLWTIVSLFFLIIIFILGLLIVLSPGTPQPFLDDNGNLLAGSLSEKIHVTINGLEQGMFIKSKNTDYPLLLFLHGGPGMPEYWLTQKYPSGLEEHFTVVWWEQRGTGLSYHPDIPPDSMTAEQFIADTLEVTRFLMRRFNREKIYLMGHSWGSYIGIQAAASASQLYHAYIGIGQVSYQLKAEQLAYQYALQHFRDAGDARMVRKMEAAPPAMSVPLPTAYEQLRDAYMHRAGIGTTREMRSVVSGIFLPSWFFREYTIAEKVNLWRGKIYSRSRAFNLWNEMQATDVYQKVPQLAVPAYFLHGKYDYTCAYLLAVAYFQKLRAPIKGFYTFNNSAHSPLFEEPAKALEILLEDVLNGTTTHADAL